MANNIGRGADALAGGPEEKQAYEHLPPELRRCLQEAVVSWDARDIRAALAKAVRSGMQRKRAIASLVAVIREADENQVAKFAAAWPAQFGRYPHVAAGATIQRYDRR
jgi:hypothetical protein